MIRELRQDIKKLQELKESLRSDFARESVERTIETLKGEIEKRRIELDRKEQEKDDVQLSVSKLGRGRYQVKFQNFEFEIFHIGGKSWTFTGEGYSKLVERLLPLESQITGRILCLGKEFSSKARALEWLKQSIQEWNVNSQNPDETIKEEKLDDDLFLIEVLGKYDLTISQGEAGKWSISRSPSFLKFLEDLVPNLNERQFLSNRGYSSYREVIDTLQNLVN